MQLLPKFSSTSLLKDEGGLTNPADSVVKIWMGTENSHKLMISNESEIATVLRLSSVMSYSVLKDVGSKVFNTLRSHVMQCELCNNHIFTLVKLIVSSCCKIRRHHLAG